MLIRLHSGKAIFLDFRETTPAALSTNDLFKNHHFITRYYNKNYLVTGVPGTVLGLNSTLKRYGTMSLIQVMTPAIKLAKQGFRVDFGDQKIFDILATNQAQLHLNVKAIFLPHGKAPAIGSPLKQPQLAATLSSIAKLGSQAFYHGSIAKQLVKASQ